MGVGWALDAVPLAAVAAIGVVATVNVIGVRRPPSRPVVLGLQQMVLGIAVVAVTGTAVLVAA